MADNTIVKNEEESRESIIKGIDTVADIIRTTVGPSGRNIIIREMVSPPIITNDGATIAKAIKLKDNTEDCGAQLIISAAKKTNDVAGDGTTTTTILAQEMIHNFYKLTENETNLNVVKIQKDMIATSNEISDYLLTKATPITDTDSIKRVATISSGSETTGELIANAFKLAGEYGSVIVEDSKTGVDELTTIQGMKLTNGSVSQFLLTDRANQETNMKDVSVLVTKDSLDSVPDLFKILDATIAAGKKLLIICDDVETEPSTALITNKMQGRLPNFACIKLPGFGSLRDDLIEDICIATGATLMGRDNGITLREFNPSYLGELEEVTITMDDSVLKFKDVSSQGVNLLQVREDRVAELQTIINNTEEEDQQEQYKRRISNLVSGVSVLKIGGNSEVEVKDRKLRIEDALNSVQSAKEEGIVAGGGYSFLDYHMKLDNDGNYSIGQLIVYNALTSVTKQIAENAGYDGEEVVNNCVEKELGFNALTGEYENLVDTGVINSVKVDRYSLINATSLASTVITSGGSVIPENEKDQNVLQLQANAIPMM